MYSLAWLVVVGVLGLVAGACVGHLISRVRSGAATRVTELEAQLESAQEELSDYKAEVYDQFSETARKFKALDESYHDLHRQLAESAGTLCGEAAGPLLGVAQAPAALAVGADAEPRSLDDSPRHEMHAPGGDAETDEEPPILVNEAEGLADTLDYDGSELAEGDLIADLDEEVVDELADLPLAERIERQQQAQAESKAAASEESRAAG